MSKTTVTEIKTKFVPCYKCMGEGRIAYFSHRKGGECFACGGTGGHHESYGVQREMTDAEVLEALKAKGFDFVSFEEEKEESDDWMAQLFISDEQLAARQQAMIGARMALQALS